MDTHPHAHPVRNSPRGRSGTHDRSPSAPRHQGAFRRSGRLQNHPAGLAFVTHFTAGEPDDGAGRHQRGRTRSDSPRAARGEAPIALRASFFSPLPPVEGSPEQLVRAICNLLVNARKSLEGIDGGAIEIETEPDGDLVAVRILDNGPGMSAGLLEQIFDPFASAEESDDELRSRGAEGCVRNLRLLEDPSRSQRHAHGSLPSRRGHLLRRADPSPRRS